MNERYILHKKGYCLEILPSIWNADRKDKKYHAFITFGDMCIWENTSTVYNDLYEKSLAQLDLYISENFVSNVLKQSYYVDFD